MYFFYNILTNLAIIISPAIIIYRILKGKEDIKRVGEKFCIYSQKKNKKKIWVHAASVGELMSIAPIIRKLEKNKKININKLFIINFFLTNLLLLKHVYLGDR